MVIRNYSILEKKKILDYKHEMKYFVFGDIKNTKVLFIHGGPGGSINKSLLEIFDLNYFCCILYDQRGCGESTPFGETKNNNLEVLVNDIEDLRIELCIDKWVIIAESWGAILALEYACSYRSRCIALILRSSWLGRKCDIEDTFWNSSKFYPQEHYSFIKKISNYSSYNIRNLKQLIEAFQIILDSGNEDKIKKASKAWASFEYSLSFLNKKSIDEIKLLDVESCYCLARLEHHFIKNVLPTKNLLNKAKKNLFDLKCWIVHGRYDVICPVKQAYSIHSAMRNSKIKIISYAGHYTDEPDIHVVMNSVIDELVEYIKTNSLKVIKLNA